MENTRLLWEHREDHSYTYVEGTIGEVEFSYREPLETTREDTIREYIFDLAEEELRQMYINSMDYEEFKELEQSGDFDEYLMDWVKEEVGYAYDDENEKAFGCLTIEQRER